MEDAKQENTAERWRELSGEERWKVIEQSRRGEMPIGDLCRQFGISRQTLYRMREAADRAARQALEPRAPGRKKKPVSEVEIQALRRDLEQREKELDRWRQKYEVTKSLLTLERRLSQGKPLPGERGKKTSRKTS